MAELPLYPEQRLCKAPTAERILELFGGLRRHRLLQGGKEVARFQDKLPTSGTEVLDLLGVNREAFSEGCATSVSVVIGRCEAWDKEK